jgi:hypothetical protein
MYMLACSATQVHAYLLSQALQILKFCSVFDYHLEDIERLWFILRITVVDAIADHLILRVLSY